MLSTNPIIILMQAALRLYPLKPGRLVNLRIGFVDSTYILEQNFVIGKLKFIIDDDMSPTRKKNFLLDEIT